MFTEALTIRKKCKFFHNKPLRQQRDKADA